MYTLRPVKMSDAFELLRWKNDPVTRKFAIVGKEEIRIEDHLKWLTKRLKEPGYFMIQEGEKLLGTLRFDEGGEVAIVIAPERRGKGIAKAILLPACSLYQCMTGKSLWAKIVSGHEASRTVFIKAGFVPVNKAQDNGVEYEVLTRDLS
jgi:L-amino acid N-acyltransferase YncA